jgi:hypothetical protein
VDEGGVDVEEEHPLKRIATAIETTTNTKLDSKGYAALLFYNHFLLLPSMIEKGNLKGATTVGLMPRFDTWDGEV